jgi:hypothetical protein
MAEDVRVETKGPVFDGRAKGALLIILEQAKWEVGMAALSQVHLLLDQSIRNPTPYYETQITIDRQRDDVVVHDRGIIYGPWLEGTGSRNRTTRFKGYASFRRATQHTRGLVPAIVGRVVRRNLSRMQ